MFKFLSRTLLAVCAVLYMSVGVSAQLSTIPVDTAVRIGKLPNGLTYYIRHNEKPKGQADFYIAQKVGSILEEDNQRGLAHFLEHMCFNGTTNFPGNSLVTWLETKGVKFGANLNAYTSIDQTVYNITNVPSANQAVVDSCLLILHDWANEVTLDPEEIDKERGVIHQEWRRSMVGQMRILENLLPVIYPGNKYGYRLPIGTMEVVDNFPPQDIRDYYETWYRPDQQGIIVVGDIDVDRIEGKIKEMFSDIEMPDNAKERVYLDVEDNDGTIYAIGSDPEQTRGIVSMMFKTDAFPNEMKTNPQYLIINFANQMLSSMLSQRLSDIAKSPDSPFATASVDFGEFFVAKTKSALSLDAVAKDDDILKGLEAAYRELLRAQRGGFTAEEYERARAEYLSRLEAAYNSRDTRETDAFVSEYVANFLDNEPIPSVEDEYKIMSQLVPMLPVDVINSMLQEYVTDDNRVIMVLAPQNDTFHVPTEAEIAEVIAKVDAEDIEPYKDAMKAEPLIPELPQPGKVVSITDNAQWGAKELTLSNGIKVFVKPTDFKKDEIVFEASAVGGLSTVTDAQPDNLIFLPIAMMQHGLGDYTSSDLQKYLQGKQASLGLGLDDYDRSLAGGCTVKDLPTLMEFIYMTFKDFSIDAKEFEALQKQLAAVLANMDTNPEYINEKRALAALYESPAKQELTVDVVNNADRQAILDIIHAQVANPADFTFCFVGDIDMDTFIPLAEQYIASLPTNPDAKSKIVHNPALELRKGASTDISTMAMQTPQTYVSILINGAMDYTPANRIAASIAGQILSNRLLHKIREEMGAVYSIGAAANMDRVSHFNTTVRIPFPMKPELKEEVLSEISNMVNNMAEEITADELDPIKEYMVKSYTEQHETNDGWAGAMSATQLNGVDFFNGVIDTINGLTTQDIQNFMKQLLDQNNYHVVVLAPEQ